MARTHIFAAALVAALLLAPASSAAAAATAAANPLLLPRRMLLRQAAAGGSAPAADGGGVVERPAPYTYGVFDGRVVAVPQGPLAEGDKRAVDCDWFTHGESECEVVVVGGRNVPGGVADGGHELTSITRHVGKQPSQQNASSSLPSTTAEHTTPPTTNSKRRRPRPLAQRDIRRAAQPAGVPRAARARDGRPVVQSATLAWSALERAGCLGARAFEAKRGKYARHVPVITGQLCWRMQVRTHALCKRAGVLPLASGLGAAVKLGAATPTTRWRGRADHALASKDKCRAQRLRLPHKQTNPRLRCCRSNH